MRPRHKCSGVGAEQVCISDAISGAHLRGVVAPSPPAVHLSSHQAGLLATAMSMMSCHVRAHPTQSPGRFPCLSWLAGWLPGRGAHTQLSLRASAQAAAVIGQLAVPGRHAAGGRHARARAILGVLGPPKARDRGRQQGAQASTRARACRRRGFGHARCGGSGGTGRRRQGAHLCSCWRTTTRSPELS